MVRLILLSVAALVPAVTATASAGCPAPLPADVQQGLAAHSIGVVDASDVAPGALPVRARQALRVAKRNFGWTHGGPTTVHLVRLVDPPPGRCFTGTGTLQPGSLAWLVVIRNATIRMLGGRGASYTATLAVFVETSRPRFVVALTISSGCGLDVPHA